jgi:Secretion system C-terminal sorting domain
VQSNGTVVTGGTQITGGTIPNWDYVLVSYTTAGVQYSLNTYSTPGIYPDRLHSIAIDSQDNLVVTGESSNSFLNDYRYFMVTVKYGPSPVGTDDLLPHSVFDGLVLFPNPSATGQFTFLNQGKVPVLQARIFDSMGRLIGEKYNLESGSTLDLSDYPPGIYLVQFSDGKNAMGNAKLIRE